MKSILISIKPEWTAKILNGEKTIEVRKTAPKCELPVDVYIYCTKGLGLQKFGNKYFAQEGQHPVRNGKIVAKFTLKSIHKYDWRLVANPFFKVRGSCLSYSQLRKYATDPKGKIHDLYGWCISDLEIFDEPKDLNEFRRPVKNPRIAPREEMHAPKSWCYVEGK